MRVKLLLGALLVCGLLSVPASACGGNGLFGGDGLFNGNGCGLFNGGLVSRIRARRIARVSNRIARLEGERSVLIDGKRPCASGQCNKPEVTAAPEAEDGAMLEVQSPGILSDIVSLDVGSLGNGSLLDLNCSLLGGEGLSLHVPSPGSILDDLGLSGLLR